MLLGCLLGSLGVLGWPLWSRWGAYENVEKPLLFVVFGAFGGSWEGIGDPPGALGAALGAFGGPWGDPGRSLRGPWGSLEGP